MKEGEKKRERGFFPSSAQHSSLLSSLSPPEGWLGVEAESGQCGPSATGGLCKCTNRVLINPSAPLGEGAACFEASKDSQG